MNRQLFPSAMRQVRGDLSQRNTLLAMVAIGLILGLSGPFDTLRLLSFGPRLMYWMVIVFATYAVGSLTSVITNDQFRKSPFGVRLALSTLAIGTCVTVTLIVINAFAFGFIPDTLSDFATQWAVVTLVSGVIEAGDKMRQPTQTSAAPPPPPLLERLPFAKRGALVALSAQDHYVNVCTTTGSELILMRLSDAIKEVGATDGLQIHRSHWVALDQIKDVRRTGDRGDVILSNDETRPISRGYMAAARDAGLLPRGRNG